MKTLPHTILRYKLSRDKYDFVSFSFSETTPHAPYNVTVTTSLFTAKVQWMPAYDGGLEQNYVIWLVIVCHFCFLILFLFYC